MAGFSDYLEQALLNHVFRGLAYSAPGTLYVALSTADPGEDGSGLAEPGTPGTTPDATNNYNRVAMSTADWALDTATSTISNTVTVTFPQATADWGNISHFAIIDAQSGGNVLMSNTISPAQNVVSGNTLIFEVNALQVTLD